MFAEKILQNEFDESNSKTSSLWAEDGVDSRLVCVPFWQRAKAKKKAEKKSRKSSPFRIIYDFQGEE